MCVATLIDSDVSRDYFTRAFFWLLIIENDRSFSHIQQYRRIEGDEKNLRFNVLGIRTILAESKQCNFSFHFFSSPLSRR